MEYERTFCGSLLVISVPFEHSVPMEHVPSFEQSKLKSLQTLGSWRLYVQMINNTYCNQQQPYTIDILIPNLFQVVMGPVIMTT